MATIQTKVITHNSTIIATAHDVAAYIIDQHVANTQNGIPAMKLQKLVYYTQAGSALK